jgi:hypothetical protein
VLERIFRPKTQEVAQDWRKLQEGTLKARETEGLTALPTKITIFSDVTPVSLVDMQQHSDESAASIFTQTLAVYSEDGSSSFLRSSGGYLQKYISQPRRI